MKKHPDRRSLLKHMKTTDPEIGSHLELCTCCQELVLLLKHFNLAGKAELVDPPAFMAKKAVDLMKESSVKGFLINLIPRLVFDSWDAVQPIAVRDRASLSERRVHFEDAGLLFELSAVQSKGGWQFTAMITGEQVPDSKRCTITVGKQKVLANQLGVFRWESTRPPKVIQLKSDNLSITLPEIKWSLKQQ